MHERPLRRAKRGEKRVLCITLGFSRGYVLPHKEKRCTQLLMCATQNIIGRLCCERVLRLMMCSWSRGVLGSFQEKMLIPVRYFLKIFFSIFHSFPRTWIQ